MKVKIFIILLLLAQAVFAEDMAIDKNKTKAIPEISDEQYLKQEIKKDKEIITKVKNNIANSAPKEAGSSVKEKEVAENQQIDVILSNRDINRILVKGDKIQSVNGPTGLYAAKNDLAGSAYISAYGESTFTVFISTVNGHNFSLLVSPKSVAGKTIILQPTTLLTPQFEEAASYQKLLIALISTMINNEESGDYMHTPAKAKKIDFYGVAEIKPIAVYSGNNLVGVISEVKNKTKTLLTLKSSYFYKPGVRAVALSATTAMPKETILLYQVMSRS